MNENKQMDISSKGRSIRQIPLTRKGDMKQDTTVTRTRPEPEINFKETKPRRRKVLSKYSYLFAAVLIVFAILFSTVFSSGKLVITPRFENVVFDSEIISKQGTGDVPFETMTLEREGSKEVTATGETNVEEKASGKIIVYNDFSTTAQKLITNTRFESNEGLVYRIRDTITVPGKKTSGSETVPGSLEVTVYADAPGEKYNISMSDFSLPALKGSAQYEKIYARSKTPMTGGLVGVKKSVSEEEKTSVKSELEEKLKAELYKEASNSKTDGYVLFNDAIFISFEEMPLETKDGKTFLKEKATLYGIIFDKKLLSKYVASKTVSSYAGEDVLIDNLEELDFTAINKNDSKPWESGEIRFNLMGNPIVVWQFDESKLRGELAGKLKKEARAILTTYPSIERAEISLTPFWNRSFPNNPEKVKIIKKIEEKED